MCLCMLSILVLSFPGRSSSDVSNGKRQLALEKLWCCRMGFQKTHSGIAKVIPGVLCHFALDPVGQMRAGLFSLQTWTLWNYMSKWWTWTYDSKALLLSLHILKLSCHGLRWTLLCFYVLFKCVLYWNKM